eukprot:Skav221052  [mRNA]  locus=scaffold1448:348865:351496:+ [translate_table: standard]
MPSPYAQVHLGIRKQPTTCSIFAALAVAVFVYRAVVDSWAQGAMEKIFQVIYRAHEGDAVYVCGSHESLGSWEPASALKCRTSEKDLWTFGPVSLPKNERTGNCRCFN